MFEKVNPCHPDKVADRIAGALVDLAYKKAENPRIAVEVLIGHGVCHIIAETSVKLDEVDVTAVVHRIAGNLTVDYVEVPQDGHLADNQAGGVHCGDNGIFKGMPVTGEQKKLSQIARDIFSVYPYDGKYILDGDRLILCQSNVPSDALRKLYPDAEINPLGDWTGGTDVDTGATNRKLGSDMADSVTGGGLHGKDLSKADVSVNIYAFLKAQEIGKAVTLCCAIGNDTVDGRPYAEIVEIAQRYIRSVGGGREVCGMGAGLMKTTTEMKLVPITKLVPYVNNARTHSPEQINKLRSSLREFGFINPVIIDRDYGVIAGHGRILAAKEEDISEVPCVFADHLTEAQKKAYIIADNRMAMDAGWDEELLRVEIESLQAADFDPLLTGFDEKELSKLFDDGIEAEEDNFDVDAELQKPTFTKSGDIWTLGRHRLICGDSTKEETYATLMDGRKANLVITDPPYNVNYEGSAGKIKNDNMASEKFFDFLFDAFSNMEKVMADDASIYVFHADTEGLNFRKAFDAAGFYLSGCCIWKKQSLVLGRSPYQWQHEPCLYGWKKKGNHQWYTGRKESTIWEFDKPKKNGDHPTMKPIPLLAYPIQNSSMANSVVLDPFGGSGSTLIACEQTDRICCTIELDEKFCDVIVRRYIEQVGTDEKVGVLRDGKEYKYSEVVPHDE